MKELKRIDENTLPEKWAIKTDRQEFYDWFNKQDEPIRSFYGKYNREDEGVLSPQFNSSHVFSIVPEGYELITFERWAIVYRPDLLNTEPETPAIPAKWCVRRTPENAEVLNAWAGKTSTDEDKFLYFDKFFYRVWQEDFYRNNIAIEITFEQWQTIPEHAEWLKENYINFFGTGLLIKATKVEEREIIGWQFKEGISEVIKISADLIAQYSGRWSGLSREMHFQHESNAYKKLKEASILELWFDPVYREIEKPVFKVGDWVITEGYSNDYDGKVLKIREIKSENGEDFYHFDPCEYLAHRFRKHVIKRHATPEEIEAARPKEIWEKYPTWESCPQSSGGFLPHSLNLPSNKHHEMVWSFSKLSQLERAWNEGKNVVWGWTIVYDKVQKMMFVQECNIYSAQISFVTQALAEKSLELHGDLWRKYHMV